MSPRFFTPALLLRKSDEDLAVLAGQGHDAAFAAIVLRHRSHLLRDCRKLLRDGNAEDAVQQTFVRALQALRAGAEVRELRPWLHRIARNVALSELAARKSDHAELSEDWEDQARTGEWERRANLREALLAVDALPARQRTALLRSAAGETPAAIAHELGVTSVAARQLLHRARVTVRAAVRVVSPPPLVWLSRRLAAVWDRIPGAAGVPAGAAPLASKIAVAVVASATVAAPVTVIHGVLSHHQRPPHATRRMASRALHPAVVVPPAAGVAVEQASPPPSSAVAASPEPRPPSAPPSSSSAPSTPAVSASSPNSAPVGTGSGSGSASASGPVAAQVAAGAPSGSSPSGSGPISTDSASSPTAPSASADSSSSGAAGSDTSSVSSADAGSGAASTDTTSSSSPSSTTGP